MRIAKGPKRATEASHALKPRASECGELDDSGWTCVQKPGHVGNHRGYGCPVERCVLQAGHGREGRVCMIPGKRRRG